jgi:hypothetical protein
MDPATIRIFLKTSAPLSLIKIFQRKLISAGSISLDSTFIKCYIIQNCREKLPRVRPVSLGHEKLYQTYEAEPRAESQGQGEGEGKRKDDCGKR